MGGMRLPPTVHVVLRPSRTVGAGLGVAALATLAVVLALPWPAWAQAAAAAGVLAWAAFAFRRHALLRGAGAVTELRLAGDLVLVAHLADGTLVAGHVRSSTYVGAQLTSIVWRPDGAWRAPVVMGGIADWPKLHHDGVLDVGIDGLGRALVVWHEANVIWARHHRGECSGLTLNCGWGPATALSTGPVAAVGRPRVAVWADGRAVVVWRQGSDVYLRRYQP